MCAVWYFPFRALPALLEVTTVLNFLIIFVLKRIIFELYTADNHIVHSLRGLGFFT